MEIEIKAKVNSLKEVEKKLLKLNTKFIKEVKQNDIYFGDINLYKKIGYSFMMRIRKEKNNTYLTYKGSKTKKDGIYEEYEFNIDNKKEGIQMLKAMGLDKIIEVNKERKEYKINNLTICLDNIKELGKYIEIESLDNKDLNKKRLKEILNKLDIKKDQIIDKGYISILLEKRKSKYSKYIKN